MNRKRYEEVVRSPGWLNNSNGTKVQRTCLDVVGGTQMGKSWWENLGKKLSRYWLLFVQEEVPREHTSESETWAWGLDFVIYWRSDFRQITEQFLFPFNFLLHKSRETHIMNPHVPTHHLASQWSTQSNLVHLSQPAFLGYWCVINYLLLCNKLPTNLVA